MKNAVASSWRCRCKFSSRTFGSWGQSYDCVLQLQRCKNLQLTARFRIKIIFPYFKNALAYSNVGVVCSC
jgi:hypothetical protein